MIWKRYFWEDLGQIRGRGFREAVILGGLSCSLLKYFIFNLLGESSTDDDSFFPLPLSGCMFSNKLNRSSCGKI